jgi:hypothetical protein
MSKFVESFKDAIGKEIEVIEVIGPASWASYFINGDDGFDYYNTRDNPDAGDKELAQADAFAEWCGGYIVGCSEESFFSSRHDASQFGVLACDCLVYTIHVYK